MDDLYGYSCAYKIDHISGVTCIYFIYNITWKTDFSMGLVLLIGQCSFLCIKSLPVSIKISPRLLEELPDHNELACIKAQPPIIFPSAMPPDLMSKQLLPMNPPIVEDLPSHPDTPHSMSTEPLPEPLILEPPIKPLVPIPWNVHQCQYSSMEDFVKHMIQNLVSCPLDDQDSPMSDALPLEPELAIYYLLDNPEGHTHTLSPDESPYRAMATMARPPREPHLPQALPVTLQSLICTYKAMHQLGRELPLYNATDIIAPIQHLTPQ